MTEEPAQPADRFNRILTVLIIVVIVVLVLGVYPCIYIKKGMDFAKFAAQNGISVTVPPKIDGFSFGARPSQAALQKKVQFNQKLYDEFGSGTYLKSKYGVDEGISGYFFGLGATLEYEK